MQNITMERQKLNVDALDDELRIALGELVHGLSVSYGQVIVHLDDIATQEDIDQAGQIVNDHDENQLTAEQQAEVDLEIERDSFAVSLDPQLVSLQDLAARIAWLEKEVRRLGNM